MRRWGNITLYAILVLAIYGCTFIAVRGNNNDITTEKTIESDVESDITSEEEDHE